MKTISTKLMLIMFCAALIIISVLDAVAITAISKTTKDTVMSSAKPLSLQGVKNFDSSVQQYVTDLSRSVRSSDFSHAADEAAMVEVMKSDFSENVRDDITYAIMGSEGQTLYSTNSGLTDTIQREDITQAISSNESSSLLTAVTANSSIFMFSSRYIWKANTLLLQR